jgi:membrane protease YdiL (CAAX protease family)
MSSWPISFESTGLTIAGLIVCHSLLTGSEIPVITRPRSRDPAIGHYARPILMGLIIVAAGLVPWTVLGRANARLRPDLPWAAVVTVAYLAVLLLWLNGAGKPRATADERRQRLRLWPPTSRHPVDSGALPTGIVVGALGLLYILWIGVGRLSPTPDLGLFPTTSYRWSTFIMGGVTSGVMEEAAFRGYMQTGLEKHNPANALWLTSLVFVGSHITQGLGAVLLLGPGLFVASMLYGALAQRTGTILPGMVIHVLGDLAYTYFGVLRGDGSLLFVS